MKRSYFRTLRYFLKIDSNMSYVFTVFSFMLALSASFQRTDSNKDGVMLLGVSKTPSGEENVIGFDGK